MDRQRILLVCGLLALVATSASGLKMSAIDAANALGLDQELILDSEPGVQASEGFHISFLLIVHIATP